MDTIFTTTFKSAAELILKLGRYEQVKHVNIDNWKTQIICNNALSYAFTVKVALKDKKPMSIKVDSNFMPCPHGDTASTTYLGFMKDGNFQHPDTELLTFMGYLLGGILLGKPLAIVNSGRGLLLERIIKDLNLTDFAYILHGFSTGGKDVNHDVEYTFPEINAIVKAYALRGKRITALQEKSGNSDSNRLDLSKRAKVEVLE
jgi:hypothetical protein